MIFIKNKILPCICALLIALKFSIPAIADDFKNYDENIVRAFKTAKIKTFSPNLSFPIAEMSDETINQSIKDYLTKTNYFAKNKEGIFFVESKIVNVKPEKGSVNSEIKEFFVINKIYNLKNPERFMFAYNKNASKQELSDRGLIAENITNNISEYAILSKKIASQNRALPLKITRASYNGMLNVMILTPKLGFGYIINPPLTWIKTNTPESIYNGISSEIEKVTTAQKLPLKVMCFKK